jgi:hypothetical protein
MDDMTPAEPAVVLNRHRAEAINVAWPYAYAMAIDAMHTM